MKTFKYLGLVLLFVVGVATSTFAQKIGHMNSDALLIELPAMKSAKSQLETFAKQKEKEIETKANAVNNFYKETLVAQQAGKLSPVQLQNKENELKKKQEQLQKAQQTAQQAVVKKEADLIQPIFDKVNKAIKDVAEENGFDYILNTNGGALLFAKDAEDVTNLVKKKLGL